MSRKKVLDMPVKLDKLIQSGYDQFGREVPDPNPIEMPVGYERPESLEEMIARMVNVVSRQAADAGYESEDEANDFDINNEEIPNSPYQYDDMQEEELVRPRAKTEKEWRKGKDNPDIDRDDKGEPVKKDSRQVEIPLEEPAKVPPAAVAQKLQ